MGQSTSSLSGGESQRLKLAYYLGLESGHQHIFFIFDEPTTGLHFEDIRKLLIALNGLIEKGHSVLVIEHNMDVIKCADWIIDLGPLGGKNEAKSCTRDQQRDCCRSKNPVLQCIWQPNFRMRITKGLDKNNNESIFDSVAYIYDSIK